MDAIKLMQILFLQLLYHGKHTELTKAFNFTFIPISSTIVINGIVWKKNSKERATEWLVAANKSKTEQFLVTWTNCIWWRCLGCDCSLNESFQEHLTNISRNRFHQSYNRASGPRWAHYHLPDYSKPMATEHGITWSVCAFNEHMHTHKRLLKEMLLV